MSVEVFYRLAQRLDIREILQLHTRAQEALPEFCDSETGGVEGTLKISGQLPPLGTEQLALSYLMARGTVPKQCACSSTFRDFLERCTRRWGSSVSAGVCSDIQLNGFVQTKSRCSEVGVEFRRKSAYFDFLPFHCAAADDVEIRRQLFADVIRSLGLPVTLEDAPKGFTVKHISGGHVWLGGTTAACMGPEFMCCEIPGAGADDLLRLHQLALDSVASHVFRSTWLILRDDGPFQARQAGEV